MSEFLKRTISTEINKLIDSKDLEIDELNIKCKLLQKELLETNKNYDDVKKRLELAANVIKDRDRSVDDMRGQVAGLTSRIDVLNTETTNIIKERDSNIDNLTRQVDNLKRRIGVLESETIERAREINDCKQRYKLQINNLQKVLSERDSALTESEQKFSNNMSVIENKLETIKKQKQIEKDNNRVSLENERELNNRLIMKIEKQRKQNINFGFVLLICALILFLLFIKTLDC